MTEATQVGYGMAVAQRTISKFRETYGDILSDTSTWVHKDYRLDNSHAGSHRSRSRSVRTTASERLRIYQLEAQARQDQMRIEVHLEEVRGPILDQADEMSLKMSLEVE